MAAVGTQLGAPPRSATNVVEHAGTARRRHRRSARDRRRVRANLMFAVPAVILLGTLSLYPMFILVQMSVSDVTIKTLLGHWSYVGLANFRNSVGQPTFHAVAVQTLVLVGAALVATLLFGFVAALILRPSNRLSRVTQSTLILIWSMPPLVLGSLWRFLLSSDGGVNVLLERTGLIHGSVPFLADAQTALGAVTLVSIWAGLPFAVLVIKSALLDISPDVIDAARIDGASRRQLVFSIMIPMIRPTLLILAVLSVVGAFRGFDFIYVMTSGGPGTASSTIPFLGYLLAFQNYQFGQAAAVSLVAMAVVMVLAGAYIAAVRREDR